MRLLIVAAIGLLMTTQSNAAQVVLSFDNDPSEVVFQIGDTTDSILLLPSSITFRTLPFDPSFSYTFEPTGSARANPPPGPLWTFFTAGLSNQEFILHDFGRTAGIQNISTWDDLIALGTIGLGTGFGTNAYLEWNGVSSSVEIYAPMSFSVLVPEPTTALLLGLGLVGLSMRRRSAS